MLNDASLHLRRNRHIENIEYCGRKIHQLGCRQFLSSKILLWGGVYPDAIDCMVGVIRSGVIFKCVDVAVPEASHGTPPQIIEVYDQIRRYTFYSSIDLLGLKDNRIQRLAIRRRDILDSFSQFITKIFILLFWN